MWTKPKLFTHTLTWRGVLLTVEHHLDFLIDGNSRLRVSVTWPIDALTPITWNGPCSLDVDTEVVSLAGGAVAFVTDWIDTEALKPSWKSTDVKSHQLKLNL